MCKNYHNIDQSAKASIISDLGVEEISKNKSAFWDPFP